MSLIADRFMMQLIQPVLLVSPLRQVSFDLHSPPLPPLPWNDWFLCVHCERRWSVTSVYLCISLALAIIINIDGCLWYYLLSQSEDDHVTSLTHGDCSAWNMGWGGREGMGMRFWSHVASCSGVLAFSDSTELPLAQDPRQSISQPSFNLFSSSVTIFLFPPDCKPRVTPRLTGRR